VLQHVSLETRRADVDAMLAFLALLGFERVEPPGSLGEISAWAERAGTQVHLLFADDPVVPPAGHAAVVVDDYEETLARLRAAGHRVDPRAEHWGAPRAFVTAPAGHRVEVMAAAPAGRRSGPGR
jgi:catechol 2,3-dioxygenase-like lactoylglutathione lyase family enzyme